MEIVLQIHHHHHHVAVLQQIHPPTVITHTHHANPLFPTSKLCYFCSSDERWNVTRGILWEHQFSRYSVQRTDFLTKLFVFIDNNSSLCNININTVVGSAGSFPVTLCDIKSQILTVTFKCIMSLSYLKPTLLLGCLRIVVPVNTAESTFRFFIIKSNMNNQNVLSFLPKPWNVHSLSRSQYLSATFFGQVFRVVTQQTLQTIKPSFLSTTGPVFRLWN